MSTSSQNPAADPQPEQTSHYAGIPPQRYEITWLSGHVETVAAHQVSWPNNLTRMFGGSSEGQRIQFHAEIDGRWALQLSAREDDIRTVRNVTNGEAILPGGAQ